MINPKINPLMVVLTHNLFLILEIEIANDC